MTDTTTPTTVLDKAPPPLHSQALVAGFVAFFVYTFPSLESVDEIATQDTFSRVLYPQYMTVATVAYARLFFGAITLMDCLQAILYGEWDQQTDYEKGSKLKTITIQFRGILKQPDRSIARGLLVMSSFTMISFLLTGIAFVMAGMVPLLENPSPWFLRIALLSFECAAPTSFLISAVVKYVLWPTALEIGSSNTNVFKDPLCLFEHNGNVIMWLVEIGLLGGLPVLMDHIAVAPLWGVAYVYYTWWMADKWAPKSEGPQFCYPFFDTTLGWTASIALVVLLLVLSLFYALFAGADHWLRQPQSQLDLLGDVGSTLLYMVLLVLLLCRFRD